MWVRVYGTGAPPEYMPGDNGGKVRILNKVGRNDPCYCGSGIKFKKCCTDFATVKKKYQASIKGVKDGNCNRESCQKPQAIWFNHSTEKYYCTKCAKMLNEANESSALKLYGHGLCTLIKEEK